MIHVRISSNSELIQKKDSVTVLVAMYIYMYVQTLLASLFERCRARDVTQVKSITTCMLNIKAYLQLP